MNINILKWVVGGLCTFAGCDMALSMRRAFNSDVTNKVSEVVEETMGDEKAEAIQALTDANKKVSDLKARESLVVEQKLFSDPTYQAAKSAADQAKIKMDTLKTAMDNVKTDATSVAVGSGDSAVAVNVTNSAAKVQAEANYIQAKAEYECKLSEANNIRKLTSTDVICNRSKEDLDIFNERALKKEALEKVEAKEADLYDSVRKDESYMARVTNKAVVSNYTVTKIFGAAALKSAIPGVMLYNIWRKAIADYKLLKLAKEAL